MNFLLIHDGFSIYFSFIYFLFCSVLFFSVCEALCKPVQCYINKVYYYNYYLPWSWPGWEHRVPAGAQWCGRDRSWLHSEEGSAHPAERWVKTEVERVQQPKTQTGAKRGSERLRYLSFSINLCTSVQQQSDHHHIAPPGGYVKGRDAILEEQAQETSH